jgi:perosamine synthetase
MSQPPTMIPVARPWMGEAEAKAAQRPIYSGWVTQGPEVAAFEQEFALAVGAPYACAVSNCTTALHLALLAVGVQPGDQVITVSHSYIATANSIRYCGATPIFVDIEPDSFNLDPRLLAAAITERTRAILCVDQMGMPANWAAILPLAKQFRLPVIQDAACAIGSEIFWQGGWQQIGQPQADIACFSFHPRKVITTGDGGMLTTANPDWDQQFRRWRQHGMSVSDTVRHHAAQVVFESYPVLGYNYRMTDIQAAIGREQLKRLPEMIRRRRSLAQRYQALLTEIEGLKSPREPDWARSNWQSYCVRLPAVCDQKTVMQSMLDQGIATRRGIMCAHREAPYAVTETETQPWLPESETAQDECIILPLFPQMTEVEQDAVVAGLKYSCDQARSHLSPLKTAIGPDSKSTPGRGRSE